VWNYTSLTDSAFKPSASRELALTQSMSRKDSLLSSRMTRTDWTKVTAPMAANRTARVLRRLIPFCRLLLQSSEHRRRRLQLRAIWWV
jgi:hypothetical protein